MIKGADWLVDGATSLAKKYNISDLAIGLTIVSFGTSAPELVVNSIFSFQNHPEIVYGNVIGSNIFNLFMILGISGLILPITVRSSTVWKEIPLSFIAIVVLFLLSNHFFGHGNNILSRFDGAVLFLMFCLFMFYVYKQMKTDVSPDKIELKPKSNLKIWGLIVIGLACLILGGELVVRYAVIIATKLGVSQKIIGLTIIAAGTSLPELMTSIVAAIKKNSDIAIGNVIGSNIFNILLILSVSSFIHPINFDKSFNFDMHVLAGGTLFLFVAMFTGKKKKLDRWEAFVLLLAFIVYTIYLVSRA